MGIYIAAGFNWALNWRSTGSELGEFCPEFPRDFPALATEIEYAERIDG